jgi:GNAT superfamily N-acetyltransferase
MVRTEERIGTRRVQHFATRVRRHGAVSGIRALVGRLLAQARIARIGVFYALDDYSRASIRMPEVPGLELRQLDEAEVRRLTADGEPHFFPGAVAASLERGDYCFGAFMDGQLVASGWYSMVPIVQFGAVIGFRPGAAWEHRLFTRPEFRGKGINAAIKLPAMETLAALGRTRLINSIEWTNDASRHLHERVGYERIGSIVRLGSEGFGVSLLLGGAREGLHIVRER